MEKKTAQFPYLLGTNFIVMITCLSDREKVNKLMDTYQLSFLATANHNDLMELSEDGTYRLYCHNTGVVTTEPKNTAYPNVLNVRDFCELKGIAARPTAPKKSVATRTLPGALLIAQERAEQIFKHGYDLQHDYKHYSIEVFKAVVISILEMNYTKWPKDSIPLAVGQKIIQGTMLNRLIKAGAFIAAAIDYIHYKEATKNMPIRFEQDESDYLAPIMDAMASFMPDNIDATKDTYNLLPIMHESPEPDTTIKGVIQRMEWLINQTPTGSTRNTLCDANIYLRQLKHKTEAIAANDYKTVDIGINPDALRKAENIQDNIYMSMGASKEGDTVFNQEVIETKIREWHNSNDTRPLHEYLGMSAKEYGSYLASRKGTAGALLKLLDDGEELISDLTGKKPPLGLRPQWLVVSERIKEITEAMVRYGKDAKAVPGEWIVELRSLLDWQSNNNHKLDPDGLMWAKELGGYTNPKTRAFAEEFPKTSPIQEADLHLTVGLQSKVKTLREVIQGQDEKISTLTEELEKYKALGDSKNPYYLPDSVYDSMKAAYQKYRESDDDDDEDTFQVFVENRFKPYEDELWANDRLFISRAYNVYLEKCTEHGVAAETFKGWVRNSLSAISLMPWIRKTHADYVRSHKGGTDTEEGIISLSLDKWLEDKLTPAPAVKDPSSLPLQVRQKLRDSYDTFKGKYPTAQYTYISYISMLFDKVDKIPHFINVAQRIYISDKYDEYVAECGKRQLKVESFDEWIITNIPRKITRDPLMTKPTVKAELTPEEIEMVQVINAVVRDEYDLTEGSFGSLRNFISERMLK